MLALRHIGTAAIAVAFVLATAAIDSADARRGGGGGGGGMRGGGGFSGGAGMRGGGYGGGGMRAGSIGVSRGFAGRVYPSHPIARPGVGRPGWGNWAGRPGYGYGHRPGYGWGAAAVGAGLAYGAYNPYYGYDYGYYDEEAYLGQGDPIAECARRFRTYDPTSQTYIVRKGVRASCP